MLARAGGLERVLVVAARAGTGAAAVRGDDQSEDEHEDGEREDQQKDGHGRKSRLAVIPPPVARMPRLMDMPPHSCHALLKGRGGT